MVWGKVIISPWLCTWLLLMGMHGDSLLLESSPAMISLR